MSPWKEYELGDFLLRRYNSITIDDFVKYKRITVRSKGGGIEVRDTIAGVDIGTKNQYIINEHQFLLSKIDALNGAFGIVPKSCDGGIITGNFWTYDIDESIINRDYLHLLCLKQVFTDLSKQASEGTTNRKYLREDKLLSKKLNLPSIVDQAKIVSKFDTIIENLKEIERLTSIQTKELNRLLYSAYTDLIKESTPMPLKAVAPIIRRPVVLDNDGKYPELGIRSFGKGTFHKPILSAIEVASKKIYQIRKGDLVFSNVFAWEGAIAVAKNIDDKRYGSHRFITCEVKENLATANFLCYHFLTPSGIHDINLASPGGAGRNKTLGLEKLMKIEIPIPDITKQIEFDHLWEKVTLMKKHFSDRTIEIKNFLPSLLNENLQNSEMSELFLNKSKVSTKTVRSSADLELAILVALIEQNLGISYGEVGLQKTVFNVESFYSALSSKYNFVNYHYGTYSTVLSDKLKTNTYLSKKNIHENEVFTIAPEFKKQVLNAIMSDNYKNLTTSIKKVLEIYSIPFINKETEKIELLNTVVKIIIDHKTFHPEAVYEEMKKWHIKQGKLHSKAEKFTFTDTVKTIKVLESLELIEKLIETKNPLSPSMVFQDQLPIL